MKTLKPYFLIIVMMSGSLSCQLDKLHENVTVSIPTLPVASFQVSPTNCEAPCEVTITNTTQGEVESYSWDFGDGKTGTQSAGTFIHTYNEPGSYAINLTATNAAGSDDAIPKTVTITRKIDLPTASFSVSPNSCFAPCEVTFTNTSIGEIDSYSWDFGDGNRGSQSDVSFEHTYENPGNYNVQLIVSNEAGSDTSSFQQIVVQEKTYSLIALDWTQGLELNRDQKSVEVQVRLVDQDNNFIPGVVIDFDVIKAGGGIGNATTASNGIASTTWILEGVGGTEEIHVEVEESENISANPLQLNVIKKFGEFTDPKEEQSYNTVFLNNMIWMAENLNLTVFRSSCCDNSDANCDIYGRLYSFTGANNACSELGEEWRLPTDQEWWDMTLEFGGAQDLPGTEGRDAYNALLKGGSSGFEALLGGSRFASWSCGPPDGYYWTSTTDGSNTAWAYNFWLNFDFGFLIRRSEDTGADFSVRCVKDDN